ncbi:MAG: mandelate racemase/muconate lactonizing enzyme family protein [Candidatus Latescibacterota bacterium]
MPVAHSSPLLPIERVEVYWGKVPVHCHFSYGSPDTFDFLLTRIESCGHFGWGETLIPQVDDCCDHTTRLLGQDAGRLDALLELDVEGRSDLYVESLSMALYDLVGCATGKPLHALLGGLHRKIVPLMPCVFPEDAEDAAVKARAFVDGGMKHLKVKLMADPQRDLDTIRAIRRAVGAGISLQGDANEGYAIEELDAGLLADLKTEGLDVIEDPCKGSPAQYARLRRPGHPAIMVDEMARHDVLLEETMAANAIDLVNLHPCQQGTFSHAIFRARMAQTFGVPEWVGGTGFIGIGTAAYQHLAGVIGLDGPCGELGGAFDHGQPVLCDNLPIQDGCVHLSDTPGHGARPRMELLEKYLCGKQTIG